MCCVFCTVCKEDQFQCSDGFCLPNRLTCNGVDDCGDSTDEGAVLCGKCCQDHSHACTLKHHLLFQINTAMYHACLIKTTSVGIRLKVWRTLNGRGKRANTVLLEGTIYQMKVA